MVDEILENIFLLLASKSQGKLFGLIESVYARPLKYTIILIELLVNSKSSAFPMLYLNYLKSMSWELLFSFRLFFEYIFFIKPYISQFDRPL